MLLGFPDASPEAAPIYLEAVIDVPAECVEAACRKFMQGRIDRRTHAFPPSVAEFARQCRSEPVISGTRLPAPERPSGPSDEERERMKPRVAAFVEEFSRRYQGS